MVRPLPLDGGGRVNIDLIEPEPDTPVLAALLAVWPELRQRAVEDVAGPETTALRLVGVAS